jgi:hypothetical protein
METPGSPPPPPPPAPSLLLLARALTVPSPEEAAGVLPRDRAARTPPPSAPAAARTMLANLLGRALARATAPTCSTQRGGWCSPGRFSLSLSLSLSLLDSGGRFLSAPHGGRSLRCCRTTTAQARAWSPSLPSTASSVRSRARCPCTRCARPSCSGASPRPAPRR